MSDMTSSKRERKEQRGHDTIIVNTQPTIHPHNITLKPRHELRKVRECSFRVN